MAPTPKINPVRRNARVGPQLLPAEGRRGRTPRWPLENLPNDAERRAWVKLWRTPQAVMWERLGWTRLIARYCRTMIVAETLDKDAMAEARQLEDRLGLSPRSMRTLLWQIVEADPKLAAVDDADASVVDIRERVRAIE